MVKRLTAVNHVRRGDAEALRGGHWALALYA